MGTRTIRDFGKIADALQVPNLIAIQLDGYERFLQADLTLQRRKNIGLEAIFREIFPIESYDKTMSLEYLGYELDKPRYSPNECRELRLTYGYPLKISCRLKRKDADDVSEQVVYLGEIPIMIGGGEFIINGAERVIVNQLHRSPGVDFLIESKEGDRVLHGGRIIPERGSWIEISVTRKDVLIVRIDQSSKIPATMFLRAMGEQYSSTEAIIRMFYETKTISVDKLDPLMWAVGPVVNTESGEIIVEAGTQIGDRVGAIRNANIGSKTEVTDEDALSHLENELEFKYVPTPDILKKDELESLEDRLMFEFPEEEKADKSLSHIPRFNKKNKILKKRGTEAEIAQAKKEWEDTASKVMKTYFKACLDKINDKRESWYSHPDEVTKDEGFEEQGVYIYRNNKTKLVKHGYVGIAHEKGRGGIRGRMVDSHYKLSLKEDSLRKNIRGWLEIKRGKTKDGLRNLEVIEKVADPLILNTLAEDDCESQQEALLKLYARLRPGNPPNIEKAKTLFQEKFFDCDRYRLGRVGRFRLNRKFKQNVNENEMTLRPEDFLNTMRYIVGLRNNQGVVDDIDHLGNRRLRTIDELASDEIRKGLLKLRRTVQERMSMKDPEQVIRIADFVNSKSVSSSIEYFFGRGELSQVVDQTNLLSQLTHERRLSALGPGGLNRKRAGFEVRDVHISHYGRICPIETPEGTNIGLIASLAIFAKVDEYGFLLTPYRKAEKSKVVEGVVYLRADEEMETTFAPPGAIQRGTDKLQEGIVLARKQGELAQVDSKEVGYIDISSKQTVGISAALIPFLEHDDANRALMGSNMMRQAVPLLKTEPPVVFTGMEEHVARNSSMVVRARNAGTITAVDAKRIVIDDTDIYELEKFVGLNERTCLNQVPIVSIGQKVKKNEIIADGGGSGERCAGARQECTDRFYNI